MKTIIKLSLVLLTISLCTAFTHLGNDGLSVIYGVAENDPSQIELRLYKDYTFTYQDFSVKTNRIELSGTYHIEDSKIRLMSKEDLKYHDRWEISKDGKIAKSRKGLSFYTLCKKLN